MTRSDQRLEFGGRRSGASGGGRPAPARRGPGVGRHHSIPAGGSGFTGGAEGWTRGGASCTPSPCSARREAAYDATAGNPPGSIAAQTTVTLNLLSLFKGTEIWNSPQFTVPVGAVTGASCASTAPSKPAGLVDVEPTGTYAVTLVDLTAGTATTR